MDKRLRVSYFNLAKQTWDPCRPRRVKPKSRLPLSYSAQRRMATQMQRQNKWGTN